MRTFISFLTLCLLSFNGLSQTYAVMNLTVFDYVDKDNARVSVNPIGKRVIIGQSYVQLYTNAGESEPDYNFKNIKPLNITESLGDLFIPGTTLLSTGWYEPQYYVSKDSQHTNVESKALIIIVDNERPTFKILSVYFIKTGVQFVFLLREIET